MKDYVIGLDLGQANDYSAMVVMRRVFWRKGQSPGKDPAKLWHQIVTVVRWPLLTVYPKIVEDVYEAYKLFEGTIAEMGVALVVDAGGPGRPVIDVLREKGLKPIGVSITAGNLAHEREDGSLTAPKRDICTALLVAAQCGDVQVAPKVPDAQEFRNQIGAFGYKVKPASGDLSYESVMTEVHDDIVVAAAIALWYSTVRLSKSYFDSRQNRGHVEPAYNPMAKVE